jgi:hypothetical protein
MGLDGPTPISALELDEISPSKCIFPLSESLVVDRQHSYILSDSRTLLYSTMISRSSTSDLQSM